MFRKLSLLAVSFLVFGCVTKDSEEIGPYPSNYKDIVIDYVKQHYFDPYSVRDAALSSPTQGHMFFRQGWVVCLRVNAKNRMGGYTGLTTTALLINRGEIIDAMDSFQGCDNQYFAEFYQLEELE